jgi:hypothetical protein
MFTSRVGRSDDARIIPADDLESGFRPTISPRCAATIAADR